MCLGYGWLRNYKNPSWSYIQYCIHVLWMLNLFFRFHSQEFKSHIYHSEMKLIFWPPYSLSSPYYTGNYRNTSYMPFPIHLPILPATPYYNYQLCAISQFTTPHPKVQCGYPFTNTGGDLLEKRRTTWAASFPVNCTLWKK